MTPSFEEQALQRAYKQNGARPVAYLDESYNVDQEHAESYYLMSAVVVHADQRNLVRSGIKEIAQGNYWHTTKMRRSESGIAQIKQMLEYLADPDGSEQSIISCQTPVSLEDRSGEEARKQTLTKLLTYLNSGQASCGAIDLFVLEKRRDSKDRNRDSRIKTEAHNSGLITQSVKLFQVSPASEYLLWLPDLVANVYRHHILGRSLDFEIIRPITTVLK